MFLCPSVFCQSVRRNIISRSLNSLGNTSVGRQCVQRATRVNELLNYKNEIVFVIKYVLLVWKIFNAAIFIFKSVLIDIYLFEASITLLQYIARVCLNQNNSKTVFGRNRTNLVFCFYQDILVYTILNSFAKTNQPKA